MDSIETVADGVNKKHGKGTVVKLGQIPTSDIDVIPSGNLALDLALGVKGYPRGRIIEIYGPESSGKSTLAQHAIAEAQKQGLNCLYVDAEHAMDLTYAKAIGVQVDDLYFTQPDSGEQALEVVKEFAESGQAGLIVVDSVAALTPRAEINGDIGDSHVGLQARLMSQALRMLAPTAAKTNTTIIFINQIREKIGVMFGSPETTPGGRALRFYASQRLDIRRKGSTKEGTVAVGNEVKVKVVKNKVAPPFRECEFEITFGEGINQAATVFDLGLDFGLIVKQGNTYYDSQGTKLEVGRPKTVEYIKEHLLDILYPELLQKIQNS